MDDADRVCTQGGSVMYRFPVQLPGRAGENRKLLDRHGHVEVRGFADRFAVVKRIHQCEMVCPRLQATGDLVKNLLTCRRRCTRPGWESTGSRINRPLGI